MIRLIIVFSITALASQISAESIVKVKYRNYPGHRDALIKVLKLELDASKEEYVQPVKCWTKNVLK